MSKILVIDDDPAIRKILSEILIHDDFEVTTAENGKKGIDLTRKGKFELIILDIKMKGMNGYETFKVLNAEFPNIPVIMMSGHGSLEDAVEFVKNGAFDYIPKPMDMNKLLITVRNALDLRNLSKEVRKYRRISRKTVPTMFGNSEQLNTLKEQISKVAESDSRVLITGPNGSGKELVALNIHHQSNRKEGPFVEVNCAAIPAELIESVLFGAEKGAYTGAYKTTTGKFEQANEGTLFLDEIGDMTESAQAKVLRALQENKITKVGGEKDIEVDVRVLAATNKDLQKMIVQGSFREDLYYRLNVVPMEVPPLDDRKEDIPILVNHFIQSISENENKPTKTISERAMQNLVDYNYQGNIRELRNIVERLLIFSGPEITTEDVQKYVISKSSPTSLLVERLVKTLGGPQEAIAYIQNQFQLIDAKKEGITLKKDIII